MKKNNIFSLILLFLFCFSIVLNNEIKNKPFSYENVTVQTKYFNVTGRKFKLWTLGKNITEFLGVPFAYPQSKDRRFLPPTSLNKSFSSIYKDNATLFVNGSYQAFTPANTCPQYIYRTNFTGNDFLLPNNTIDEDCLQLNMWVPDKKFPTSPNMPVIVFIYGGSFATGSASLDPYNASILAANQSAILVNLNYRVGPLGFAYFGEDTEAKGNMGLLDQQEGLKWVYENIHHFGGDNKSITLFGHSAGAASVTAHLLSNNSDPYFSKIIVNSGAITNIWATVPSNVALNNTLWLASIVNCTKDMDIKNLKKEEKEKILKCMQNVSTDDLNNNQFTTRDQKQPPLPYTFLPIYNDSIFFGKNLFDKLKEKKIKTNLKAMFGRVSEEGSYFLPFLLGNEYGCGFNHSLGSESKENQCDHISGLTIFFSWLQLGDFYDAYIQEKWGLQWTFAVPLTESNRKKAITIFGDFMFVCDTALFANITDYAYNNAYAFEFHKRSTINPWPQWMGVMHGYELEYIFGMPFRYPERYNESVLEYERNYSTRVMTFYFNFAQAGIPHSNWQSFTYTNVEGKRVYDNEKCAIIDDSLTEYNHKFKYTSLITDKCAVLNNVATNHPPRDALKVFKKKEKTYQFVNYMGYSFIG